MPRLQRFRRCCPPSDLSRRAKAPERGQRVLTTLPFTDIVGSSQARIGCAWLQSG